MAVTLEKHHCLVLVLVGALALGLLAYSAMEAIHKWNNYTQAEDEAGVKIVLGYAGNETTLTKLKDNLKKLSIKVTDSFWDNFLNNICPSGLPR